MEAGGPFGAVGAQRLGIEPPSRRTFLRLLGGAICVCPSLAADTTVSPRELTSMEGVAYAFMRAHALPGLSVAVARDGHVLYERGFGYADRESLITPSHLFRIASISKPITSVTLFHLMEEKHLTLDDFVFGARGILGESFGAAPYGRWVEDIRIKHLLTHTCGGWPNDNSDPMFRNTWMDHQQLITWGIYHLALDHSPGEHYAYSNFGFCILGRVIERLAGIPYELYARDVISKACGVSLHMGGNTRAERAADEVEYFDADPDVPYNMNIHRMDSCGGWLSRARDLAMFAAHVDGYSLRSQSMQTGSVVHAIRPNSVNSGWFGSRVSNWSHTGSLPGTSAVVVRSASGLCWAALANTREASKETSGAMEIMMRDLVGQVSQWRA
jgi:CubicO group peptidase (beta-lactamase class C family)